MSYTPNPDAEDGERIAQVETVVCDMHTRLFGNGQPGILKDLDGRVSSIEKWMWRCIGGGAVLVAIFERWGK